MGFMNGSDSMAESTPGATFNAIRQQVLEISQEQHSPSSARKHVEIKKPKGFLLFRTANIVPWSVSVHRCAACLRYLAEPKCFQTALCSVRVQGACVWMCSGCGCPFEALFEPIAAMNQALDVAWSR